MARSAPFACITFAFLLAGCSGSGGYEDGGFAGDSVEARKYSLAHDLTVAISAGNVWHIDFRTNGGLASYDFELTDDSSVNIGFMRTQNVEAYASGSAANMYGGHSEVSSARDSTVLDADEWSLVIACGNAFLDCDGILNEASFYSA